MKKKYYYAVREGRKSGIYLTWEDCEKQIKGYKNAIYKKFEKINEAQDFIKSIDEKSKDDNNFIKLKKGEIKAYVDGSYSETSKECGFGVVLFMYKEYEEIFSKLVPIKKYSKYRNVTGEVFGSLFAINKAIEYNLSKIYIFYDYEGIRSWAKGYWKTNNELTKFYRDEFLKLSKYIQVEFLKVKAHSGNKFNDLADRLAKLSVGI